jgi:hypothetical protein
MRFQTPQFIEVEDKIFGPLTLRQFIYLAGSAGVAFMFYTFLPTLIAFALIMPVAAVGLMLAFYKINNKPFINTVEAAFKYIIASKLYVWKKLPAKLKKGAYEKKDISAPDALNIPRLSESRLKEIAWSLDVHDINEERQHSSDLHKREQIR